MKPPLSPAQVFPAGSTDITQRFVTLDTGVTLRVVEGGPADGPPLLMLPGWGAPAYMFRHAFAELSRQGVRVVVAEMRGFGLSDKPKARGGYGLEPYIADLNSLITALGYERIALAGQSMGGAVALRFALRHPDRVKKLVLINPAGLVPMRFVPLLRIVPTEVMAFIGKRAVPRWVVEIVLRGLAYGDPRAVGRQDIEEYWAPTQLDGYVYAARATLSEFDWSPITNEEAASLTVPSVVILGKSDRLIHNDEACARRLTGTTVHWVPGGHCAHEETPEQSYRVIGEFVMGSPAA